MPRTNKLRIEIETLHNRSSRRRLIQSHWSRHELQAPSHNRHRIPAKQNSARLMKIRDMPFSVPAAPNYSKSDRHNIAIRNQRVRLHCRRRSLLEQTAQQN
jgi:hypothetical protein